MLVRANIADSEKLSSDFEYGNLLAFDLCQKALLFLQILYSLRSCALAIDSSLQQ